MNFVSEKWAIILFFSVGLGLAAWCYALVSKTSIKSHKESVIMWISGVIGAVLIVLGFIGGYTHRDTALQKFDSRCAKLHGTVIGNHEYCIQGKVLFSDS